MFSLFFRKILDPKVPAGLSASSGGWYNNRFSTCTKNVGSPKKGNYLVSATCRISLRFWQFGLDSFLTRFPTLRLVPPTSEFHAIKRSRHPTYVSVFNVLCLALVQI